jgi:hypothetical protein
MFSSSSTTRIVSDILTSTRKSCVRVRRVLRAEGQLRRAPPHGELHHEAATARQVVPDADEAVVVGDDRRHDGEPEAGAVGLGREVGLEEPGLHLGRHARAVVGDLETDDAEAPVVRGAELDARGITRRGAAADGTRGHGVVEQVDHRALDPLPVHLELGQLGLGGERELDLPMALAEQDERLLDHAVQILRGVGTRGHPREVRELVHQRLQLVHLLDDRPRAVVEHRVVGAELRRVAAAEPLGRELDRRQGVLDLVRDAARDLAPRLHALHPQEVGHVLEEEHEPARAESLADEPGAGEKHRELVPVARELQLPLHRCPGAVRLVECPDDRRRHRGIAGAQLGRELADVAIRIAGEDLVDPAADGGCGRHAEERLGGAVHGGDPSLGVGRDHAGRDVREHGLEIATARLELGAAGLQLGGHPVEGGDQRADLVLALPLDAMIEVALRDRARALGEALDGDGDPASQVEAEPRRGEQHDDRRDGERDDVVGLDRAPLDLEAQVLVEGAFTRLATLDDAPGHVRIHDDDRGGPPVDQDRCGGADHVGLADRIDQRRLLSLPGAADQVVGRRGADAPGQILAPAPAEDLIAREDLDHVELVLRAALVEEPLEGVAASDEPLGADPRGDLAREAERRAREILVVGVRDLERALEGVLHLTVEPPFDRVLDEDERDQEEERRGQEGDRDERADEPRPEMRAHDAPAPLEDELRDVPPDQEDEENEEDEVEIDERDQNGVGAERARPEGLREPELEDGEQDDRGDDPGDDPRLTPSAAHLGRDRPGGRRIGRAGHWEPADDRGKKPRRQGQLASRKRQRSCGKSVKSGRADAEVRAPTGARTGSGRA